MRFLLPRVTWAPIGSPRPPRVLRHRGDVPLLKTITGRQIDLFNMTADDVDIIDIAHGLSRICRFGGHVHGWLSVAEHCVRVAERCVANGRPDLALQALYHDAAEAYIGDMPSPIKHRSEMAVYRHLEHVVEAAIWEHMGWTFPIPEAAKKAIKQADIEIGTEDCAIWRYAPMRLDHEQAKLAFLDAHLMYSRTNFATAA